MSDPGGQDLSGMQEAELKDFIRDSISRLEASVDRLEALVVEPGEEPDDGHASDFGSGQGT